jgi:hypothetical protein
MKPTKTNVLSLFTTIKTLWWPAPWYALVGSARFEYRLILQGFFVQNQPVHHSTAGKMVGHDFVKEVPQGIPRLLSVGGIASHCAASNVV